MHLTVRWNAFLTHGKRNFVDSRAGCYIIAHRGSRHFFLHPWSEFDERISVGSSWGWWSEQNLYYFVAKLMLSIFESTISRLQRSNEGNKSYKMLGKNFSLLTAALEFRHYSDYTSTLQRCERNCRFSENLSPFHNTAAICLWGAGLKPLSESSRFSSRYLFAHLLGVLREKNWGKFDQGNLLKRRVDRDSFRTSE